MLAPAAPSGPSERFAPPVALRLVPDRPVDVVGTVAGLRAGGQFRVVGDGIWWMTRPTSGPATVHLRPGRGPLDPLDARAWGPGADDALSRVRGLVGFDDDPSTYQPAHPALRRAQRQERGLALGRTGAVLEALLPTVVAQKVPSVDAARSWRRLVRAFAEPAPGPAGATLVLPPDPDQLAALAYHDLHRFGIERKRAEPLLAACRAARRLEALGGRGVEALVAGLCQLPGIGLWTALSVARVVGGHPDVVVVGDYGLPAMVAWNLAGERTADDERMLELLDAERPNRARAVQLVLRHGHRPPRRGPRLRPTAIAGTGLSP